MAGDVSPHAHDIKHHPGQPPDRRLRQRDRAGPARDLRRRRKRPRRRRPQHAANCTPQDRPNRATAPDGTTTGQSREPLGDKLAKSDGVLCPPSGVDPDMHAPAPDTGGNTPVIPPPAAPAATRRSGRNRLILPSPLSRLRGEAEAHRSADSG